MSFQIHGTLLPLSALLGVAAKTKATVSELLTAAFLEWLPKRVVVAEDDLGPQIGPSAFSPI